MGEVISLWPLTGIAVIVVGFLLRFNPVLVVIIAGIVTGLAAHMPIATILEKLGEGFLNTRNLPFILLIPLAVIGLLERHGLKERAQAWIAKIRSATSGRLLIVYLFIREATAALGLTSLGGASADGASAAGADGGRGRRKKSRRDTWGGTLSSARHVSCDR